MLYEDGNVWASMPKEQADAMMAEYKALTEDLEAKDLSDAIQVASRIPSARQGSIEVRPIMEFDQG